MKAAAVIVALILALIAGNALAQEVPEKEQPGEPEKKTELDARVEKLIKQLGSDEYKEREAATGELTKIGEKALPALKEALKSKDLEVRLRAETVIKALAKERAAGEEGRPTTPDPTRAPSTSPRFGKEMEEVLKDLPEEMRKQVEKMLEQMGRLEKELEWPRKLRPRPDEKKENDENDRGLMPDEIRKMFEEMQKSSEKARKRAEERRKQAEERRKRLSEPRERPKPEAPKTEPRDSGEQRKKPDGKREMQPLPKRRSGATIVIKRLTWKDGKLVEDKEFNYDSALSGLSVTDSGHVLDALRYHLGLGEKEGILVDEVEKDSRFAKAGVHKHDIITKAGGKTVDSRETLARLLDDKEEATLEVMRRGKRMTIELDLSEEKKDSDKDK
jgi:hypothetical protein